MTKSITKPAASTDTTGSQTPTTTVTKVDPNALFDVQAVCLSVQDLGFHKVGYSLDWKVRFTFQTEAPHANQITRIISRTFNQYYYEGSCLCNKVESWTGRNLAREYYDSDGKVPDWTVFEGRKATLRLKPKLSQNGTNYEDVIAILPSHTAEAETNCQPQEID